MDINDLIDIFTDRYGEILETHAMWKCISALGAKLSKSGNQWCFLWGENLEDGICGFGNTVFDAATNFYKNVKYKEIITQ